MNSNRISKVDLLSYRGFLKGWWWSAFVWYNWIEKQQIYGFNNPFDHVTIESDCLFCFSCCWLNLVGIIVAYQ